MNANQTTVVYQVMLRYQDASTGIWSDSPEAEFSDRPCFLSKNREDAEEYIRTQKNNSNLYIAEVSNA